MRPLRAAVIGVGEIGRQHARVYRELEGVDLVGLADPDPAALKSALLASGAEGFTDSRQLLEKARPDLVSVAVPTHAHSVVATEAIRRGIPVLVEKPLAGSAAEGQQLVELAERSQVPLMVGQIERFNPVIAEVRRRLALKELGQILQLRAVRVGPHPQRVKDVGVVLDLATHDLDMMRYLIGERIERVYAETQGRGPSREDLVTAVLRFTNGVIGVLDVNWLTPVKVRQLTILGQRGLYHVDYLTQDLYVYEASQVPVDWESLRVFRSVREGNVLKVGIEKAEPLRLEIEAFVQAVLRGTSPPVNGRDGLETLRLAEAVIASSLTKQPRSVTPSQ